MQELKPCNHCGNAVNWCEDADHKCHRIVCATCGYSFDVSLENEPDTLEEYRARVTEIWNRRALVAGVELPKMPQCDICENGCFWKATAYSYRTLNTYGQQCETAGYARAQAEIDALKHDLEQSVATCAELATELEALKQSFAQPAQAAVPEGWISIHDRLPETKVTDDSECVLAGRKIPPMLNSEKVLVAYLNCETQKYHVAIDHLTGLQGAGPCWWNWHTHSVHFWQPLPAAPKHGEQK